MTDIGSEADLRRPLLRVTEWITDSLRFATASGMTQCGRCGHCWTIVIVDGWINVRIPASSRKRGERSEAKLSGIHSVTFVASSAARVTPMAFVSA
jgi:hypothetical protein